MADAQHGSDGRVKSARWAHGLASALTGWAMLIHLFRWPQVSFFLLAFSAVALALSLKTTTDHRDRAASCFSSGSLLASLLLLPVLTRILMLILLGPRPGIFHFVLEEQLLLLAAVLFAWAGAFFWLASNSTNSTEDA
jgi:hypothetical protein